MKLNYRDKVILGILLAIVILVAGFFAAIKPKSQEIDERKATRATKQSEQDEIKKKIAQIKPLTDDINDIVAKTNDITGKFVEIEKIDTPELLDRYMQSYADKNKLKLTTLDVSGISESVIPFYFYTPSLYGVTNRTAADINGTYTTEEAKKLVESTAASQRTAETAMVAQYGFTATGTKEDIWNYLSDITESGKTILINSVELEEVDKEEGETPEIADDDILGKLTGWPSSTEYKATVVLTLYSVYDMEAPVVEVK